MKMKFLLVLIITVLIIQGYVAAASVSDVHVPLEKDAEGNFGGLLKKHHPRRINCNYACSRRCSLSSRKHFCHRACTSCCARCNCVPPGTYGNKALCPCYAKLRTHGNKPKCP